MTRTEARETLLAFNLWRRDRSDVNPYPMPDPKMIGLAIEVAIAALAPVKREGK